MGYTTDFEGSFKLNPPATPEQIAYINKFSSTRRMMRDISKLKKIYKGEFGFLNTPYCYGHDGEYFVGGLGYAGQDRDESVYNEGGEPPRTQPGLWCHWVLSEDGTELKWNGAEKFYKYIEWLQYMIDNFFTGWGIELSGEIKWQGQDELDYGTIKVRKETKVIGDGIYEN